MIYKVITAWTEFITDAQHFTPDSEGFITVAHHFTTDSDEFITDSRKFAIIALQLIGLLNERIKNPYRQVSR